MKILKSSLFFRFCCALALASVFFGARPAVAHEGTTDAATAEDVARATADIKQDVLKEFVEHAAEHFEGAQSFEQAAQLFNGFRNERSWKYEGIYIVLLTARGGVYVHPNRELEDQDWSALPDEKRNNVGAQFLDRRRGWRLRYVLWARRSKPQSELRTSGCQSVCSA